VNLSPLKAASLLALAGILAGPFAAGQTVWSGSSSTNWSTSGNWSSGVPGSSSTATFSSSTSRAPVIGSSTSVGELIFSGSANQSITGSGSLTINANVGSTNLGIYNSTASFTPTISAPIVLGNNTSGIEIFQAGVAATPSSTAGLTFNGALDLTGTQFQITPTNVNNTITFNGLISDTGGGGKINTTGAGTVVIAGANTSLADTVTVGGTSTLKLTNAAALGGATGGPVNVNGGATLALSGGINLVGQTGLLTLNNNGSATSAILTNAGGNNSWQGNIALGGNATISSGPGVLYVGAGYLGTSGNYKNTIALGSSTLTLSAAGTPTGAPTYQGTPGNIYDNSDLMVNSAISGTGGINIAGVGTVTLGNQYNSTYSGPTNITILGKAIIDAPSGVAGLAGTQIKVGTAGGVDAAPLTVLQMGDTASAPGSSYVLGTYNATNNTSNENLTVYGNGVFNMNGSSQGLTSLTMDGGTVSGQAAGQTYSPQLTIGSGGVTTLGATAQTSVIQNGILALVGNGFTFNVANGSVTAGPTPGADLLVSDKIVNGYGYTSSGSGTGFTSAGQGIGYEKTGAGTMVVTSDNTTGYQGVTEVHQGVLNIQNSNALGQNGSGYGSLQNSVQVDATGAQLQLQGGITLNTDKTVVLNGTGISSTGALLNVANTNTVNGEVILGSNSQINANHGTTLSLTNTSGPAALSITGSGAGGQTLTLGGGGTTVVNGAIGGTTAKVGAVTVNATDGTNLGTVILAGTNNYTGATTVTKGTLEIASSSALATSATVASGATLAVAQDYNTSANITVSSSVGITLNGAGTGATGSAALENVSGSNTVASAITLGSASSIKADTGTSLTVSGAITGTNQNLTLGGAGNVTLSGAIGTGSGTLTKVDSGTATLSNGGTNGYTGLTTVSAGTLQLGGSSELNATNELTVASGATFNLDGFSQTLFSGVNLSTAGAGGTNFALGTGTANINFGTSGDASTLTLSGSGTVDYSGTLNGTGTIIVGSGVNLVLQSSGTLIGGKYNIDDSNLNIVLAGGTLSVNGTNDVLGSLTFQNPTSTINFSGGNSVLDFTGTVTAANTTDILQVSGWTNAVDYFYSGTEPGAGQGTAPLDQIVFDSPTWTGANTTWESYVSGPDSANQITPVPEPGVYGAVMAGCAVGLVSFSVVRRRSAKSNKAYSTSGGRAGKAGK
jgi:fibronectin-binding autotransporter adhesin